MQPQRQQRSAVVEDHPRDLAREPAPAADDPARLEHATNPLDSWPLATAALLAFLFVTCLLNLGGFGLVSMEGMVANGGAAMLEGGNWAVPRVYGEIYTYKPALAYWLSALPQALISEPSALWLRLPFALSGVLLGVGVFVLIGRAVRPFAGLCAAMATTGGGLFLEKIRLAEFDGVLTAFVGLAVALAVVELGRERSNSSLGLWLAAYVALALGVLAKGALAVMVFGPGLLAAVLLRRQFGRLFSWQHLAGATVFALLIGAYLGWAMALDGTQILTQPGEEAGWRTIGWTWTSFGRTLLKPVMIFGGFLPWTLGLLRAPRGLQRLPRATRQLVTAALGFALGGVLIFMAVPTHEMRYYLPLAASLGIAAGVLVAERTSLRFPLRVSRVVLALTVLLVAAAFAIAHDRGLGLAWWPVALVAGLGLALHVGLGHTRPLVSSLTLCSLVAALFFAQISVPGRAVKRDLTALGVRFAAQVPAEQPIWVLAPADKAGKHSSLLHALDREVRTFTAERPPPAGAFVFYEDSRAPLGDDGSVIALNVLDTVEHASYTFRLAQVPRASRQSIFGANSPGGMHPGGALTGLQRLEPPPGRATV